MPKKSTLKHLLFGTTAMLVAQSASAATFNIPAGSLEAALDAYSIQSGVSVVVANQAIQGVQTRGVTGDLSVDEALGRILKGTGFVERRDPSGTVGIVRRDQSSSLELVQPLQLAQATPARAAVETVTVTSSKLGGGDVQSIPIAITAMSQEQLTATQTAGGPDLIKSVPNMTFTKTNFTGYSIQIRGIGTQAISATTDPAVAVALNDIPFIRNHFFEQEFYDLSQAEVLRGPQGTLYGRNATAGVVNLVTAKPTDQFEAMASGNIGNYKNRRFEGMINLPIVDDRIDLRLAGEWTKRGGYTQNALTGNNVDGRDLWSGRLSLAVKPVESVKATLLWEHFYESDDRMRTAKQLCKTDPGPSSINGVAVPVPGTTPETNTGLGAAFAITTGYLSQGCLPASLYSPESFEVPNGFALPYVTGGWISGLMRVGNPYASSSQSTDLRAIETQIDPVYKAKNDTVELNIDFSASPAITVTSQTGYNQDFLWSTEDYNRFNTAPDVFFDSGTSNSRQDTLVNPDGNWLCGDGTISVGGNSCSIPANAKPTGYFCDPQLGCSSRLVAQDLSEEHSWQISQELRISSNFSGPLNFSAGGNFLHYETEENYYVLSNALTLLMATSASGGAITGGLGPWIPGISDNHECLAPGMAAASEGRQYNNPNYGAGQPTSSCYYIDPNSLSNLNNEGHNYFLSQNPYVLNSYAGFGETYYSLSPELKLTAGLRWTDDEKHFVLIPSELLSLGIGYASTGVVDQRWQKFTGRFALNWTPALTFSDQTLVYGSFARGYKAGGANPPGPVLTNTETPTLDSGPTGVNGVPVHPFTFNPEFVNAFELGSKNAFFDGSLTLNGDIFFYDYKGYQISEIVDRTSINLNFDATVNGAELEATYEPLPGLRFRFSGGYEHTRIANGEKSVDLMDRTAGHEGWVVLKPFVTQPSNCIMPDYVVAAAINGYFQGNQGNAGVSLCGLAYSAHVDPITQLPYKASPTVAQIPGVLNANPGYPGFNPDNPDINGGNGFAKDLSGNELPNAPKFTTSFSAEYTIPLNSEWAGTLHGDFYWQAAEWARVFNDDPYDRIHGFTNVNLALILTSQGGWQVMGYVKNLFDTTAITGTFLNSDDSGLTTNIFLTDPRLFGVRVTKNW